VVVCSILQILHDGIDVWLQKLALIYARGVAQRLM
jgi:hypothetical protein